jgi:hypothetical protein
VTDRGRVSASTRRRAHRLGTLLASPGDAWLMARICLWRLVLPVLKRRMPLPRLVGVMWAGPGRGRRSREREARIAELVRFLFRSEHHSRSGNCLERSLVLYRYLSAAGAEPELMVGLRPRDAAQPRGHAWITVGGALVAETPDELGGVTGIVSFRGDGSRAQGPPVTPNAAG